MNVVTALFKDRDSAERAYEGVMARGYEKAEIAVVMSDVTRERLFSADGVPADTALDAKAAESAGKKTGGDKVGGPLGGTMGTLAPALAAAGVFLLLPGIGIIAAGPLAVALTAAGTVGLAGGLIGALTHWGIPGDRTEKYEAGVRAGKILMGVEARSKEDAAAIKRQWSACGAEGMDG